MSVRDANNENNREQLSEELFKSNTAVERELVPGHTSIYRDKQEWDNRGYLASIVRHALKLADSTPFNVRRVEFDEVNSTMNVHCEVFKPVEFIKVQLLVGQMAKHFNFDYEQCRLK